jgi:hypothetical protein
MFTFTTDYYLLVFASTIGVIQIAVSMGPLRGLQLFRSRWLSRSFGLILATSAFIWFFATDTRNLNDFEGGLDANTQALFFFLGALTGVVVTLVLSSVVNARMANGGPVPEEGLDALRHTNYARGVFHSLRYWWREWRTQMKSYFFG